MPSSPCTGGCTSTTATPLDAKVVETVDEGDWTRELVRMNAAYAGDSLLAYLYLPKRGTTPVSRGGLLPRLQRDPRPAPQNLQWRNIDFVIKSGRAVLYPVYKGTYQRSDSLDHRRPGHHQLLPRPRDHVGEGPAAGHRLPRDPARGPHRAPGLLRRELGRRDGRGDAGDRAEDQGPSVLYVAGLDFESGAARGGPGQFPASDHGPDPDAQRHATTSSFPIETSQIPMFACSARRPTRSGTSWRRAATSSPAPD